MPAPPHASWVTELTVTVGITNHAVTTDASGVFTLTSLAPGTYDIRVKSRHTLRKLKSSVTLVPGNNAIDLSALLEGDANNDNFVYIDDFYVLKETFATADPRADFNQDGLVTLLDFYPIKWNFLQRGDGPASGTAERTAWAGVDTPAEISDVTAYVSILLGIQGVPDVPMRTTRHYWTLTPGRVR